ncbi:MAG TPA: hypothetical protein VFS21_38990 [Roseiflexaceae bacterium]|nr:hypothetical protein [Roseiflexaceae bacterium]
MVKLVVGLFDRFEDARQTLDGLVAAGVARGVVSAVAGAEAGRTLDQAAQLALTGVGPALVAGPLAGALVRADGDLVGRLTEAGVPHPDAEVYHEALRRGGSLLLASVPEDLVGPTVAALERHGPVALDARATDLRSSGWRGYADGQRPYSAEEIAAFQARQGNGAPAEAAGPVLAGQPAAPAAQPAVLPSYEDYDGRFRDFYNAHLTRSGYTYEQCGPVFRFAYALGRDRRYNRHDWPHVEREARRLWEERNPNSWDRFKDAICYAWEHVRADAYSEARG